METRSRYFIKVIGIVQGVGFRPFVYNLATFFNVFGWVSNYGGMVVIDIEGDSNNLKLFIDKLKKEHPKLAVIHNIDIIKQEYIGYKDFKILPSKIENHDQKFIPYDVGTCDDCIKDISDPNNKRYHYPFTNCTSCGPRYSIIKQLPYDRINTTMNNFKMCPSCQAEYDNPTNRRFHAQPNCCPKCGPNLLLLKNTGEKIDCVEIIGEVINQLKAGKIIAIKGLGGFHLVCDAMNEKTIELLRIRKNRPHKPFAIMINDLEYLKSLCELNKDEENILLSNKSPIIILKIKNHKLLPKNIAPNLNTIGVMFPYTPLHHLLFESDIKAYVMTSANMSSSLIQYDNQQALDKLNCVSDFFLMHNRDIYLSIEDSVVKVVNHHEMVSRRGRGYSPYAMKSNITNGILALGSEEKGNFSFSKNGYVFLSHYLGDLKDYDTYNNYLKVIEHFKNIMGLDSMVIAHDLQLYPVYKGNKYVPIQHHHAHMVSCMVEHEIYNQVIGVIYDGTGLGTDGKIWGGELLIGDRKQFTRVGHLKNVLIQGGNSSIHDIWKIAYSYLYSMDLNPNQWICGISETEMNVIKQALKNKVNCYESSSLGRLFDCISVLLNLLNHTTYQAQGAIELENIINPLIKDSYDFNIIENQGVYEFDYKDIIKGILYDLESNIPQSDIATKFHNTIGDITVKLIYKISDKYKINDVVLSGGVFENRYLLTYILDKINKSHLKINFNKQVPINDGGVSLGQLAVAAALESE